MEQHGKDARQASPRKTIGPISRYTATKAWNRDYQQNGSFDIRPDAAHNCLQQQQIQCLNQQKREEEVRLRKGME